MVRSLVAGFGAVTVLAAAASLMPAGQVMLGMKHTAAAQTMPAAGAQDRHVAKRVVPAKPLPRARPQARRAAPARQPQAALAPLGQSLDIGQLLPLLQSQFLPAVSPVTGMLGMPSGGGSVPDILQQLTTSALTPAPAPAPQPVQAPAASAQPQPQSTGYASPEDTGSDRNKN